MKEIDLESLKQRIGDLLQEDPAAFQKFNNYRLKLDAYPTSFNSKPEQMQREVIFSDALFELVLIYWPAGYQPNAYHDHAENGCLLQALEGEGCEERILAQGEEIRQTHIRANSDQWLYIDNSLGYHRIFNTGQEPFITLHIYSPPGHQYKVLKAVKSSE